MVVEAKFNDSTTIPPIQLRSISFNTVERGGGGGGGGGSCFNKVEGMLKQILKLFARALTPGGWGTPI